MGNSILYTALKDFGAPVICVFICIIMLFQNKGKVEKTDCETNRNRINDELSVGKIQFAVIKTKMEQQSTDITEIKTDVKNVLKEIKVNGRH